MFVIVSGPTAVGKSAAAVELAKLINGEIISADSMQVYRGMDTGTYKVTREEMSGIPHHLIDIMDPDVNFSAAQFKALAESQLDNIKARGRVPVLCGGTGLYINAIIRGIMKAKEPDAELKNLLRRELEEMGPEFMVNKLNRRDPDAASVIDLNNPRRVIRALELIEANGKPLAVLRKATQETIYGDRYVMFVLDMERNLLYDRINSRVDNMIKNGLVAEVKKMIDAGVPTGSTAMQAIGYRQIAACLNGKMTLAEAVEQVKQATRNYARRQLTWFKRYDEAIRLDAGSLTATQLAVRMKAVIDSGIK
ncbi:MAG: tRNA (adenosine(37)-N6)-dimethylallyltransferase MiaA [Spirochaetia bacterium]|nr:tRNA (adenosine(37)-N6)-dimethylallyltransferase MiaA [Spirochaetia bacterium]